MAPAICLGTWRAKPDRFLAHNAARLGIDLSTAAHRFPGIGDRIGQSVPLGLAHFRAGQKLLLDLFRLHVTRIVQTAIIEAHDRAAPLQSAHPKVCSSGPAHELHHAAAARLGRFEPVG